MQYWELMEYMADYHAGLMCRDEMIAAIWMWREAGAPTS